MQQPATDEKVASHFSGKKSAWRPVYDELIGQASRFGADVDVNSGKSYLSLRKAGKKFAIVAVAVDRLDVGVKLKDVPAGGRLEAAGSWNAMVTHRVRIRHADDIDPELLDWLEYAYASA